MHYNVMHRTISGRGTGYEEMMQGNGGDSGQLHMSLQCLVAFHLQPVARSRINTAVLAGE